MRWLCYFSFIVSVVSFVFVVRLGSQAALLDDTFPCILPFYCCIAYYMQIVYAARGCAWKRRTIFIIKRRCFKRRM